MARSSQRLGGFGVGVIWVCGGELGYLLLGVGEVRMGEVDKCFGPLRQ